MFPVAGIESLSGGATGEPYKGKHGQKRWEKMRENVIKEWEAEQLKKEEAEQQRIGKDHYVSKNACISEPAEKTLKESELKEEIFKEPTTQNVEGGKMRKLKQWLSK